MVIKYIIIFHSKAFQTVPELGIWFENKPSGNPAGQTHKKVGHLKTLWKVLNDSTQASEDASFCCWDIKMERV
jgi:hypothetical protein